MRLKITHRTDYSYDMPVAYALQRLRLVPGNGATQAVKSWTLSVEGAREELKFVDHFGNDTRLLSVEGEPHTMSTRCSRIASSSRRSSAASCWPSPSTWTTRS